ncbi:uncharacterized protein aq_928-like isoform X2 [Bradysia coprophila]|uniref:uncharacterized protein aq_928-like isoform X2 n=1 Tax=Bradysia coprophila TaxID=38358 RepID=UPI00187DA92E|nr:uncharacterized protein aq_928-like isoform X2 [Bradysia coprophila]
MFIAKVRVARTTLGRLLSAELTCNSSTKRDTIIKNTCTSTSAKEMADEEKIVRRNPHGDFKSIEASRPAYDKSAEVYFTQTHSPNWKPGDGSNDNGECLQKSHIAIDPHEDGRPSVYNYKLLISAIVPRPIGFISTRSADGSSTNIAPFSYFQTVNHDPPLFVVSFSGGLEQAKDTLRNLVETKECVINIVSEHFIEAANATSTNAPYGVSEWVLSGLTPADCCRVKSSRVKEAIFSIEGILVETKEFDSRAVPGKKSAVMAIIEGVQFWAREDAINDEKNLIDLKVLRPVSRFGGIMYGRTTQPFEIPRPDYNQLIDEFGDELAKPKADGQ